ncbi:unnamed protein product, partial [Closterium sp. NIES-65]
RLRPGDTALGQAHHVGARFQKHVFLPSDRLLILQPAHLPTPPHLTPSDVYDRVTPRSGKPTMWTLVFTQVVSALWHVSRLRALAFVSALWHVSRLRALACESSQKPLRVPTRPTLSTSSPFANASSPFANASSPFANASSPFANASFLSIPRLLHLVSLSKLGLQPGYYLFFVNGAIGQHTSKLAFRHTAAAFPEPSAAVKAILDVLQAAFKMLIVNYSFAGFLDHGKEEHGKEEHGKEEHGKEEHGKEEHGKEEHGKEEHGKEEHGKGEHGKGEHGKGEHGKGEVKGKGKEEHARVVTDGAAMSKQLIVNHSFAGFLVRKAFAGFLVRKEKEELLSASLVLQAGQAIVVWRSLLFMGMIVPVCVSLSLMRRIPFLSHSFSLPPSSIPPLPSAPFLWL